MRSVDRYLAKSKLQTSTKCELSEAKLHLALSADVGYGEERSSISKILQQDFKSVVYCQEVFLKNINNAE